MAFLAIGLPHGMDWFWIVPLLGLWTWALIECALREKNSSVRLGWLLAIFFGQILGAVLYLAVRRPARLRQQTP